MRSAVGHNFPWEAMEFLDVPKVKVCRSGGGDCGNCFDEVGTFARGVTATMMESYPPDSGSSEMKSTLMASQRSSGIGSGWSSPLGKRRCILVRRHRSQWETYMPTYRDMFGHQ